MTQEKELPGRENAVKIGLWGPPQSGKTTYLAALTAAVRNDNSWMIWPLSEGSTELKNKFEKAFTEDLRFPETTVNAAVPLEWLFVGNLSGSRFDRRRLRWLPGRRKLESRFVLDLIDVQGSAYLRDPAAAEPAKMAVSKEVTARAFDHLAESKGIIFLFDPIGERDNRNSATYLRGTINELLMRAARNGRPGRYLHHQVSVCITKFDDPDLFRQASEANLVALDEHSGMPFVRDTDAKKLFNELCDGKFWSKRLDGGQQSAEFVRDSIGHLFDPQQVRYFVTSSIGFSMEPPAEGDTAPYFDMDAPSNINESDELPGIKGKVRPINVLEPLISLQQRIARG